MDTKWGIIEQESLVLLGFFLYVCNAILNMTALHISVFKIKIVGGFRNTLEHIHLK